MLFGNESYDEYEKILWDFFLRETKAAEAGGKDRLAGVTPEEFEAMALADYLLKNAS